MYNNFFIYLLFFMIKQNILVTVDNVVFTIINDKLQVLLIKRIIEPFKDMWAIPGGFVLENETLDEAAYRELFEETNVKDVYLEQLYTFWNPKRDPRWHVISITYLSLVPIEKLTIKAWSDAKEAKFFPINRLPKLAFDHKDILKTALSRLKWKLTYSNIAKFLLPDKFTLSWLQKVYEIILEKKLDTRNFRKKIDKLWIIEAIGEKEIWVTHRPAMLYKFKNNKLVYLDEFL